MILFLSKNEDIIKNDAEKATDFLTKLTDTLANTAFCINYFFAWYTNI